MRKCISVVIVTIVICMLYSVARAEETTKTLILPKSDLTISNAAELLLSFSLGGANVNITQSNDEEDDDIVKAIVTFDSDEVEPILETALEGDIFSAAFASGLDVEFDISDINKDIGDFIETWDITIGNYDVDTDIVINAGGIGGDIDLGGMPLKNGVLNLGGVSLNVDFSVPTSRQMEALIINGGGVDLSVTNIGNTDFEEFDINVGGAKIELDFNGTYVSEQHNVNAVVAGGVMDVVVPSDAGEKLCIFSIAAVTTVTGDGWERTSGLFFRKNYETDDYESQDVKIDMEVIATGSVVSVDRE